jgi:hypothetical protein
MVASGVKWVRELAGAIIIETTAMKKDRTAAAPFQIKHAFSAIRQLW